MPTWEGIRDLRKAGQPGKALEMAKKLLADTPGDLWIRRIGCWAVYDFIKESVKRLEEDISGKRAASSVEIRRLTDHLATYSSFDPEIPGMATSYVLFQLAKVGRHVDAFVPLLRRYGENFMRPEDYAANQYAGKAYPSWAMDIAREAAGWIEARQKPDSSDLAFVIGLISDVKARGADSDKTWLDWDMAKLQRRAGNHREAATFVVNVLRRKRTESWVWTEVGRIHREEQPELSIACFCQALRLGSDPKFLVKTHRELAELLAGAGEWAQASKETTFAAEIYDREGWRHPRELEDLLQSDWYDPSLPAQEPRLFYAEHADEALTLCFDEVLEQDATYLGVTESREGKKPKPRFAVLEGGLVVSRLGRRGGKLLRTLSPGSPVKLLVGIEGQRRDILEVHPRPEGAIWDCTEVMEGVVSRHTPGSDNFTVYLKKNLELRVATSCWSGAEGVHQGGGVRLWGATNPVNSRFDVCWAESAPLPQRPEIRAFRGALRVTRKGDGFVDDVFVPGRMLEALPPVAVDLSGVAVRTIDRAKQRDSWLAVVVTPLISEHAAELRPA